LRAIESVHARQRTQMMNAMPMPMYTADELVLTSSAPV
jgi:hypothetical protein